MSEQEQNSSGVTDENPVGDLSENQVEENRNADSVRYDTYRKVLGEKKKYQSELDLARKKLQEIEERDRLAQEQELKEQSKWQEYAQKKEEEAKELASKINQFETREIQSRKLDAVLKGLNEDVPQKFWGMIELDAVVYDAQTGEFDETSLNAEIQRIKTEYPEIIVRKKSASHDPSAPSVANYEGVSAQQFASMPKDKQREALKNMQNVPAWMRGQF